jgi:hypothetical protein
LPVTPPQQYLTLSLKGLGFDTFQTNLLSIPYTVIHSKQLAHRLDLSDIPPVITLLAVTYAAEVFGELSLIAVLSQVWTIPMLIWLNVVDTTKVNKWSVWAVITILLGYPYCKWHSHSYDRLVT